jgi:membrane protease YdiL (CAAX protease family)
VALFYFSIHLGKPMMEAVSSFFGGLILGSISYHSKSIWGGLLVHISIALLMELFGFIF